MQLRTRLILALGYVVLLAIVALEIPLGLNLRDRVDAEVRSQADGQADLVAASAVDLLAPRERARLRSVVRQSAATVRGRVIIVDAGGEVLVDSSKPAAADGSYGNRPEVAAALHGNPSQQRRHSASLSADILATAVPIARNGHVVGAVRITQGISSVHHAIRRTILELVLVGVAVLLIGLAAGALIARQIARPLHRLEETAERVAAGELDARADEREGSAEQRSLAASFNEMTARVGELLASQRRFVADASHQLRTPLAGLRLRLEAVAARHGSDRDIAAAEAEVARLSSIVDDLLELSRAGGQRRALEPCDLLSSARTVADRFAAAASRDGVTVRVVEDAPGATGYCAPADLDRALDALVENALLYGGSGGEVEIGVQPGIVEVRDRGPGPAVGEEDQVFERFHRGAAAADGRPGTGLGLAIARTAARGWGGDAILRQRAGGGAVAVLAIPTGHAAGQPEEQPA